MFHDSIGIVSAAGVLLTLVGVALVVLRHGPRPAPASAAQLLQQKTMGRAAAEAPQPLAQVPSLSRALSQQPSFRKLASIGRASIGRVAEGGSALLGQLGSAASAQLDSAPSVRARDFAVAADGMSGPCMAVMAASIAAYDMLSGSLPVSGGADPGRVATTAARAAAAAGAAEAVASALGEDDGQAYGEGARLIPAGTAASDDGASAQPAAGPAGSSITQQPPDSPCLAPRMSSHLSGDLL